MDVNGVGPSSTNAADRGNYSSGASSRGGRVSGGGSASNAGSGRSADFDAAVAEAKAAAADKGNYTTSGSGWKGGNSSASRGKGSNQASNGAERSGANSLSGRGNSRYGDAATPNVRADGSWGGKAWGGLDFSATHSAGIGHNGGPPLNGSSFGWFGQVVSKALGPLGALLGMTNPTNISEKVESKVRNVLAQNGQPIGYVQKGATPNIGTLEPAMFDKVVSDLLNTGATPVNHPTYDGTWYDTGGGSSGFGIRESKNFGRTIDTNVPGIGRDKFHRGG
jgi:hypothetical protein